MKILILNDTDTPSGGAELMTLTLKNEFIKLGHEVSIFSSNAYADADSNFSDYQCYGTLGKYRTLNRAYNFSAYTNLKKALALYNPDIVHIRMFFTQLSPSILPLLKNIPTVYHATWLESVCPMGIKLLPNYSKCNDKVGLKCYSNGCLSVPAWFALIFQNKLFYHYKKYINAIIANSNAIKNQLLNHNIGPIDVIYNGVPKYQNEKHYTQNPSISCATRLSWEKGIDLLINAFANVLQTIPTATLTIAGDGDKRAEIEQQIAALNLQNSVFLIGHQSREELNIALADAWVHVVPSRCEEGFGLTAAEAMMRSTAVIASGLGGLAEIVIDNETGFLVPPNNQNALETKLITLLQNQQMAIDFGKNGKKRALEYFSEHACANQFIKVYNKLLANNE